MDTPFQARSLGSVYSRAWSWKFGVAGGQLVIKLISLAKARRRLFRQNLRDALKGFLIPLSAVLALLASIVRLLLVSNYQTTTAVAVASGAGPLPTLIGTLIPVVQVFLPILTIGMFLLTVLNLKNSHGGKYFLVGLCSLVATFLITPTEFSWDDTVPHAKEAWENVWPYASIVMTAVAWAAVLAVLAIFVAILVRADWKNRRTWDLRKWRDWDDWGLVGVGAILMPIMGGLGVLVIAVAGGVVAIAIAWVTFFPLESEVARIPDRARSMWLPAEEVSLKSGNDPTVGYVLGVGNGWMTLLQEPDRTVRMVPLPEVVSRKICRFGPPNPFPLLVLPGASIPDIPRCHN